MVSSTASSHWRSCFWISTFRARLRRIMAAATEIAALNRTIAMVRRIGREVVRLAMPVSMPTADRMSRAEAESRPKSYAAELDIWDSDGWTLVSNSAPSARAAESPIPRAVLGTAVLDNLRIRVEATTEKARQGCRAFGMDGGMRPRTPGGVRGLVSRPSSHVRAGGPRQAPQCQRGR